MVAKDSQKEEREKALFDSWEQKEPGRKEKAKSTRLLFELKKKKLAGAPLTEEELRVLNEPKAERYALEDPTKAKQPAAAAKGGKPVPAAAPKKPAAVPGKKDPKEAQKEEEVKKEIVFPKSEDHPMTEVRAFLRHMEKPRMNLLDLAEGGKARVRVEREFEEIFETCLMNRENALSLLDRFAKRREDLKAQRDKVVPADQVYDSKVRQFGEEVEDIKKRFESLKDAFSKINAENSKKKENEDALLALLSAEAATEAGLKEAIQKAKDQHVDPRLVSAAEKFLKNAVIRNVAVNLKEKLDAFDEPSVRSLKELIEQQNIEIEEDLHTQMEEFFMNVAANPNYIAEKLAELKKQPKTKKK